MATIKDLRRSISQMAPEEAFNLVKEIRFQRRQVPPKKSRAASSAKKPKSPKAAIAAMTKEQRLQLLKELGG